MAVFAATVVGLIAVGRWVVRLGLLPLTRMEHPAQDITRGICAFDCPTPIRAPRPAA